MINSRVRQIASLIEQHLSSRGLVAGDSYLTADEVGREFSVHPRSASRAMKMLAKRGVLMRRRGLGTFVGPNVRPASNVQIRCVHVLVSPDQNRMGFSNSELIEGVLESTGCPNVQFNLLPATGQVAYVRELVDRGRASETLSGCVLVGCLREIQEAVMNSGVPAVVFGGVYPTSALLSSVDADQAEIGYLLTKYLLGHGRHHLALITRETWLPGDSLHHDGIRRALGETRTNSGGIMIRGIPLVGTEIVAEIIAQLLAQSDRPAGLICRGPAFAKAALSVANEMGLAVPEDLEIVFDHWTRHSEIGLPHAHPVMPYREQARLVGETLKELVEGKQPEQKHVVIGVQLAEEEGNGRESGAREGMMRIDRAELTVASPLDAHRERRRIVELS